MLQLEYLPSTFHWALRCGLTVDRVNRIGAKVFSDAFAQTLQPGGDVTRTMVVDGKIVVDVIDSKQFWGPRE